MFIGELAGVRAPVSAFSPLVGADAVGETGHRLTLPLQSDWEHALVLLRGGCRLDGQPLTPDTLYYLGCGRRELVLTPEGEPPRLLLLGGAPFGETVLMWWNFVARTTDEIVAAREDWQAGRRFGDVSAYRGARIQAPSFIARPVPRR